MSQFLPHTRRPHLLLAAADVAGLVVAVWLAHLIRFRAFDRPYRLSEVFAAPGLVIVGVIGVWALAVAAELYEPWRLRRRREVVTRLLTVAAAWGGGMAVATYVIPSWRFGRGLLLITTIVWALLAATARFIYTRWPIPRSRPTALVVGDPEAVAEACRRLARHPLAPWAPADGSAIAANDVGDEARRRGAELVLLVGSEEGTGGMAADLAALLFAGVPVVVASEVWAWLDGRLPIAELSPAVFLHQPGFGAIHWETFNRLTRVVDVVLASLMLVCAAPILSVAGLAVLAFDGWPVLYFQVRVGQFGRRFRLAKLRTMRRDAEVEGPAFAAADDPRVTRVGRVLRRLRIDELPQLANVLKGEMSLVGPRPERPEFVAELSAAIPYYSFRLAVPPGLTGWAQVNIPYARTLEEHRRKLEYDLYFIRERSLGIYLVSLLRTASAALAGAGR